MKLRLDPAARQRLERRLAEIGARDAHEHDQVDLYLAHPARDFARTDEALRVRANDGEVRVTYKGPKLDPPHKTREEIEFPVGTDVETAALLFARLGFRPVARVHKRRREIALDSGRTTVCIDEVRDLGTFCEIECGGVTTPAEARAALEAALMHLGLAGETPIPASYLELLLAGKRSASGT